MSGIEKAIENLKSIVEVWDLEQADEQITLIIYDSNIDAMKSAIQALEEKQQREQNTEMTEIDKLKGQNELLNLEIKFLRIDLENTGYALEKAIEELEEREQKWIPVSERLPESAGETVLLTVSKNRGTSHGYGSIDIAHWHNKEKRMFYGTDGEYTFDEVKAWCNLPPVYKEVKP